MANDMTHEAKNATTHTPRPWQAIGSLPAEGWDGFEIKAQPSPALRGFTKVIGAVAGPQSNAECLANAHLISAAPDMLEALEFIYSHIADKERGPRDLYSAFGLNSSRAIEMARAAILKATGAKQ